MFRLNQKGAIDAMFIVALVLILAVGGFLWWRISSVEEAEPVTETVVINNSQADNTKEVPDESGIPEGWISYSSEKHGFSFLYPEKWGSVQSGRFDGDTYFGKTFSANELLFFGGPTKEYTSEGRGGTLTDPSSFSGENGDFSLTYIWNDEEIALDGTREDIIDPYKYVDDEKTGIYSTDRNFFEISCMHAIFNLNSSSLGALNFESCDNDLVSEQDFITMIESVEVN